MRQANASYETTLGKMSGGRSATKLLRALAVLTVIAAGTLAPAPSPAAGQSNPTRILAIGDSICEAEAGQHSWRYWLGQHFQASAVEVAFVGRDRDAHQGPYAHAGEWDSDHECIWGQAAWQERPLVAERIRHNDPDVVVMMLGTNDIGFWQAPATAAAGWAAQVIDNALAADAQVRIVVGQIPPAGLIDETKRREYNDWLTLIADVRDRVTVAPAPSFNWRTDTYDSTHPNSSGEDKLAEQFARGLADIGIGPLDYRNPDSAAARTGAPLHLSARADATSVDLAWDPLPIAYDYRVHQSTDGRNFAIVSVGNPSPQARIGNLAPGTTYWFKVDAALPFWTASALSAPVRVTTRR